MNLPGKRKILNEKKIQDEKDMLERARRILGRDITPIDHERMEKFVSSCNEHAFLFMQVVADYGSPLYVVDRGGLVRDLNRLREAFARLPGEVDIFYALKSNSMPEIMSVLVREGAGIDVSSGMELGRAVKAGAKSIIFSGPGKTDEELSSVIDHAGRVTLMIDSFGELDRIDRLTRDRNVVIRAGVRLATGSDGLWRRFGIPLSELRSFIEKADRCPFIELEGLQFHTSWNLTPGAQVSFIEKLGETLSELPVMLLRELEFIDLGGGYWPEHGEWLRSGGTEAGMLRNLLMPEKPDTTSRYIMESTDIETFAGEIAAALRRSLPKQVACRFFIEPGRWLCHQNMHILMTVVDVKADDMIITDAGTGAVGWERYEHDYFPVINLSSPGSVEHQCGIFGPLCTPHDVWGYSCFGGRAGQGDVLLVPAQGAYTYSLRQEFIKPLPGIAVVQGPLDLRWSSI